MAKKYFEEQIKWLNERFPDGKYQDVLGLCKVAKIDGEDGIEEQEWSLNPGRYVGVVIENDGLTKKEFIEELDDLKDKLDILDKESIKLKKEIEENLTELLK